jgi:acetyl-CoA C-acetyltransferase
MQPLSDVVAISAVRTPMGRFGGTLREVPVYDLGATAVRAAVARAGVSPDAVDDVILGNCRQAGNGVNPARSASRFAGLPDSVPAISLNMACPSGMKAMMMASQSLRLGEARLVVAGRTCSSAPAGTASRWATGCSRTAGPTAWTRWWASAWA